MWPNGGLLNSMFFLTEGYESVSNSCWLYLKQWCQYIINYIFALVQGNNWHCQCSRFVSHSCYLVMSHLTCQVLSSRYLFLQWRMNVHGCSKITGSSILEHLEVETPAYHGVFWKYFNLIYLKYKCWWKRCKIRFTFNIESPFKFFSGSALK